jgi:hypothetical protein
MGQFEPLLDLGCLYFDLDQKQLFKEGKLHREWAALYPFLFDSDDIRLVESQGKWGTHFIEWLGAIVLYRATNFYSLLGKYEFKTHLRKCDVVKNLSLPDSVSEILRDRRKGAQCPDLLMYAPDLSNWFFCEIKGGRDKLKATQRVVFERLAASAGRPVCLLSFKSAKTLAPALSIESCNELLCALEHWRTSTRTEGKKN